MSEQPFHETNHQLVTDYYVVGRDELLAYVNSRMNRSDVAEDIVQEVFLRLLTSRQLISEATLPCLAYTIARNLLADYYRRHSSRQDYEHYVKGVCSVETSSESVLSIREITEQLEHGLARLPENCREVYRLHIYEGQKVSEITKMLGEDYKRVEHQLGLARKAMRQYLRKYA